MADREPSTEHGLSEASRYWDQVLDPQNLERDDAAPALPLEDEIAFADTPDFSEARRFLNQTGYPAQAPRWTVDLGAGLGASAFLLARAGYRVIAIDTSISRLRALRARAAKAGVADRVTTIVASAESLPFATGSIPALYTRAVLIHVDLDRASSEIGRILIPHGRAALLEPTTGNPLVNLYRRFLAPKAWQSITHYFDSAAQKKMSHGSHATANWSVKPFYFLSFLAFVFQFEWPKLSVFRFFLHPLVFIDKILFAIPLFRRLAWFGVIELQKAGSLHFNLPDLGSVEACHERNRKISGIDGVEVGEKIKLVDAVIVKFKYLGKDMLYVSDDAHGEWIESDIADQDAFDTLKPKIEAVLELGEHK